MKQGGDANIKTPFGRFEGFLADLPAEIKIVINGLPEGGSKFSHTLSLKGDQIADTLYLPEESVILGAETHRTSELLVGQHIFQVIRGMALSNLALMPKTLSGRYFLPSLGVQ